MPVVRKSIPIAKRFLLTYPDGGKKYIDREERDTLILSQQAKPSGPDRYAFTGQVKTYHALSDLAELRQQMVSGQRQEPDYYPGEFVFELRDKRWREGMQSAEALAIALPQIVARLSEAA